MLTGGIGIGVTSCSVAVMSCVAVWSSHLVTNSKRVNLPPKIMRGDRVFWDYFTKGRDVELEVLLRRFAKCLSDGFFLDRHDVRGHKFTGKSPRVSLC